MVVFQCAHLCAQEGRGDLRFVWYNVENLFDPFDDSLILDEEFLPGGLRQWNWVRFERKIEMICKVIAGTGGWAPSEIVALAEVENDFVLHWLCRETPLLKYGYRWIHEDSPDPRGIDIALLYLPDAFKPLQYTFYGVDISPYTGKRTRDILHVKGIVYEKDTLHLILNHWPSRWEGKLETENRRRLAALRCRRLFDSITVAENSPAIIVSGDFNDEASDPSIRLTLGVQACETRIGNINDTLLYSLSSNTDKHVRGSLKYRGRWYLFDQVFTSGSLLCNGRGECSGLYVLCDGMKVYRPDFLLERDIQWAGLKPFRTWNGYHYAGGFSDHLPVYVDLWSIQVPYPF